MGNSENDTTMQAGARRCCGSESPETDRRRDTDQWIDEVNVLDAQLPEELRSALGRFVGKESIDTLGEWATEIRRLTGGGAIDVDHLSLGIRTNAHEESGGNPTGRLCGALSLRQGLPRPRGV